MGSEKELPRGVEGQNKTDDASHRVIGGLASHFFFDKICCFSWEIDTYPYLAGN